MTNLTFEEGYAVARPLLRGNILESRVSVRSTVWGSVEARPPRSGPRARLGVGPVMAKSDSARLALLASVSVPTPILIPLRP